MKILIIDNTLDLNCWGSPELVRFARKVPGATIHVRRAPQNDLPSSPAGFDRVIVSGSRTSAMDDSPWVGSLLKFIRHTLDLGKPYLGICYGHQILTRALGSIENVGKSERGEYGWTKISLSNGVSSPLLAGLPSEFFSFSSHREEVKKLPQGLHLLASSRDCAIQACQLRDQPVFGIQFHPEKSLTEAEQSLAEHKKRGKTEELLFPGKSKELYNPSIGETIFGNFLK